VGEAKTSELFRRMDQYELAFCLRFNRACRLHPIERVFGLVSRLGDGVFWYAAILLLPLIYGPQALVASAHMAGVGLVGVLLYKWLKGRLVRSRPFVVQAAIHSSTPPLDRYSFPSGHTLHAVAFSLVGTTYYPELAWIFVPFAVLVALSRLALGLHYPTDVMAGAAIGGLLAVLSLAF